MKKAALVVVTLTFIISSLSYAHSGRTNKDGCHNDRKAGTYHCH
ncbi:MAG: YHYH domain-containing protein [Bacteroidetes bacterium]|nr:YHYH domain-containing protein [Bacteroidota bacterium]